ncbi:MAG: HD domain-containing protein [Bacteroidota bacterium]
MTSLQQKIINSTINFVKLSCEGNSSGHDWSHISRVTKLALYFARKEKADTFIVELAALLHDVDDWKFNDSSSYKAKNWLLKCNLKEEKIHNICTIIQQVSFKSTGEKNTVSTLEAKIVQDADRLDAIGAIGIARAFAYGGSRNRELFNPEIKPAFHYDFHAYKNNQSNTINHFYEKLLLLKDQINTDTAKEIAISRHDFMLKFLDQFYSEWNCFDEYIPLKNNRTENTSI